MLRVSSDWGSKSGQRLGGKVTWQEEMTEMTWFLAVRIDRSAGRERWFWGGGVLKGEGDRDKIGGEVRGGLVIEEKMRDRMRERGEKGNDRLVGRNVRRGSAVLEGDEVDVPQVGHHQDVLVAVV